MDKYIKIGESWLVVNEKGQLCELVNLPIAAMKKYKGKILKVDDAQHIEDPVNGLDGRFGSIHFVFRKKDVDDGLGW